MESAKMPATDNQVPAPKTSLWQELRNALRGTEADYTQINMRRAIFLLAVPMILELVLESTFALVDIYFVGELGAWAVSVVGLTETYLYLLYSMAMGLAMAVTAIIARRIGEKNREAAGKTGMQAILLGLIVSLPFAIAGIFFSRELLGLMGADAYSIENGHRYMQWMLGGNVVIVLLFVINAIFRGAGDAAIAMRVLWLANGINIILDPIFIRGWGPVPAMGVEGAAIATTIGRGIGVAYQLFTLFRGGKHIRAVRSDITWDPKIVMNIFRTSLGGVGQTIVGMASWIFLMRILADIGKEAVAGATITLRIMMFTMMPAWGMSNATATLVGQNLGAGKPDRAESAVWKCGTYNMILLIGVSVIFFLYHDTLMGFFTDDKLVISIGGDWLQIFSYSFFVYGWWMVSSQAFNGAGDTRTPTYINLVFFWLIQIPLSWFLALQLDWGYKGVFWGVFISETSVGLFTLWLFTRGKWKTAKV
jgi:putative MATE family efflux protein